MHGNVREWCLDWADDSETTDPVTDPAGPAEGSKRRLRGGSYYDNAHYCRSASRFSYPPSYSSYIYGFRVVLVP